MRRARGTARPTGQRPDVDPQPPRPPTGPAAARGPRRRRPVTAGGAPPRAGRPPAPEGPADARRPPPRRPPPETRGRARPRPSNPHTPGAAGPAGPRPLAPAHPLGGPLPEPAFPGTLPPPHTPPPRAEGRGSDGELGAKRAGDTRQRYGRGENRAGEPDRRPREAWGVGDGAGESPEARKAWGGEAPGDRRGRPRAADGRPAGDRPRQTGPGPATGGGGARQAAPRRGAAARHAAQPARRDRRIRAARIRGLCGGRQSWPAPRGERRVGWGGGVGSLRSQPPHHPTPEPSGPTSRDVAGRAGLSGRGDARRRATPPGDGAGWRGAPGRVGGNGGAEGPAAGGGARAGKQAEENPPLPTRYPHNSATPPPHLSRAAPRPPDTPGSSPRPAPGRPWGAGRPPDASRSPPLPSSRSHPAPHGRRRGSRAGRGAGRGPRAALGTDRVNDPSAGSPTETLLRLLLPLDSQVRPSSQRSARAVGRPRRGRSEGLTKPSNR